MPGGCDGLLCGERSFCSAMFCGSCILDYVSTVATKLGEPEVSRDEMKAIVMSRGLWTLTLGWVVLNNTEASRWGRE
jgi:hypothetical protein